MNIELKDFVYVFPEPDYAQKVSKEVVKKLARDIEHWLYTKGIKATVKMR